MLARDFVEIVSGGPVGRVFRRTRDLSAPSICGAIHRAVLLLDSRLLPSDLRLKHVYDYRTLVMSPASITFLAPMRPWSEDRERSFWRGVRGWYELGGSWKNAKRHISRNFHGRFVADGQWDLLNKPMEILPVISQLFAEGRSPRETEEYQKLRTRMEVQDFRWTKGCRTVADLDDYYARLIRVYEDIRARGYRSQMDLGFDGSDEIRVCVDRNGQLAVLGGGTHRLSMAKVLGVARVPVIVKRVHALWVDELARTTGATNLMKVIERGLRDLEV